ncbi:hypothetical protein FWK35_00005983 [Aphis craccivora]|uniref:Uncharacterized protein n=1 Tax=Aphis craccivora TaxID=307492 RepID=A0A6G0YYM4_APHCR|nr:hypothetical protein FWK35_00005983 [Aphis craccivora]
MMLRVLSIATRRQTYGKLITFFKLQLEQLIRNLVLNFQNFLVIQNFFIDTSKKITQKNRKFLWSINNSKSQKNFKI